MTRRSLAMAVAVAAVLTVVAVAVLLALWRGRAAPVSGAAGEPEDRAGPLRLELGLIGGQPLAAGTPVFLSVSLEAAPVADPAGGELSAVGKPARPWWEGLRLERRAAAQGDLQTVAVPLVREPVLHLESGETGYARVAIAPGSDLDAGAHLIEAVWQAGALEVRSNAVELEIRQRTSTERVAVARARFELWRGAPGNALTAVEEGLAHASEVAELHSLRGRSLEALGRLDEARADARRALEMALEREETALSEPPVTYFRDLARIEEKLAGGAGSKPR